MPIGQILVVDPARVRRRSSLQDLRSFQGKFKA